LLGVSRACIQYYERTGRLHPVRNARGIFIFDREEVEALAHKRRSGRLQLLSGEICAEAFTRFQAGDSPADVVIALALPPEYVNALWQEYKALENQRPSRGKVKSVGGRPRTATPATPPALSLVPSSTPSNVSAWSRQWDAEQAQRARRRTGYRP
jgi:DNA-binding transcriptional MerR regulator